ncbi:MAG: tetratricopeptide repeat protein [Gammaproteobacteria bacterium]|jgi:tetratricopeptide (TPR) repeat protein
MRRTPDTASRWALAALLTLLAITAQAQDEAALPDLELVPHPDMSGLDPEVRERLEPAFSFFRDQRMNLEGDSLGRAYGRMGINYFANGQEEAAGACMRNAMALDSNNPRWPYLLGVLYEQTGEAERALESYGHTLDLTFAFTPALIRRSRLQLELGQVEDAETGYTVAVRRNPEDAAALAGLGDAYLEQKKFEEAAKAYVKALSLDPEADYLHGQLAAAYRGLGDTAKASAEAARAGDRRPAMDDPLMAFVQSHTLGADHYVATAKKAEEYQSPDAAIKLYEIATSIRPGDVGSLIKMGELKIATGDGPGAMNAFGRALAIEPDNARANYFAGTLFEQLGEDSQAEDHYRKALEAEPQLVEPRLLLANSLMRRQEFSEAGEHYGQIAHQLPRDTEVMYLLGMAWLGSGDCKWAHPVLARGLAINPGDGQILVALARAYSICEDATEEQLRQALETATVMYTKAPSQLTAETLAMASAANGRFDDAVDFQAQAMFEALKTDRKADMTWMQDNMARYQAGQRAAQAWSPDADVFKPRRLQPVKPATPTG